MESLLTWNLFQNAKVSFLPTGYTHKDIDHTFSMTSKGLGSADAVYRADLGSELWAIYGKKTTVVYLKRVVSWSGRYQQEQVLENVPAFFYMRHFSFSSVPTDESRNCSVPVS